MKYLTEECIYEIISFNESKLKDTIDNIINNKTIKNIRRKLSFLKQVIQQNNVKYPLTVEVYNVEIIDNGFDTIEKLFEQRLTDVGNFLDNVESDTNTDPKYWLSKYNNLINELKNNRQGNNTFRLFTSDEIYGSIIRNKNVNKISRVFNTREDLLNYVIQQENIITKISSIFDCMDNELESLNSKRSKLAKNALKIDNKQMYINIADNYGLMPLYEILNSIKSILKKFKTIIIKF